MKKEAIISILFGLIAGLVITFFIYQSKTKSQETLTTTTSVLESKPKSTTASIDLTTSELTVNSPDDETVQAQKVTRVNGIAEADNYIVIYVNNKPNITQADQGGNFSLEIELVEGSNVINVHAVKASGETHAVRRTVIVNPEFLQTTQEEANNQSNENNDNDNN